MIGIQKFISKESNQIIQTIMPKYNKIIVPWYLCHHSTIFIIVNSLFSLLFGAFDVSHGESLCVQSSPDSWFNTAVVPSVHSLCATEPLVISIRVTEGHGVISIVTPQEKCLDRVSSCFRDIVKICAWCLNIFTQLRAIKEGEGMGSLGLSWSSNQDVFAGPWVWSSWCLPCAQGTHVWAHFEHASIVRIRKNIWTIWQRHIGLPGYEFRLGFINTGKDAAAIKGVSP